MSAEESKIVHIKARVNTLITKIKTYDLAKGFAMKTAIMGQIDVSLKELGKLGMKPLTEFEQKCLDEVEQILNSKLNNNAEADQ